jgi:hypothetical protein
MDFVLRDLLVMFALILICPLVILRNVRVLMLLVLGRRLPVLREHSARMTIV